jgi:predicted MFS family arabinose efflux permease
MRTTLLILTFVANTVGRLLFSASGISSYYFLGDSFAWGFIASYVYIKLHYAKESTKNEKLACLLLCVGVSNNIYDDLLGNPSTFSWNEATLLLITLLITWVMLHNSPKLNK